MGNSSTNRNAAKENDDRVKILPWSNTGSVLFLALIFFVNFTSRVILAPFFPTIERELGISHGQAGSFFFLISVGYFAALMGSGFFSARLTHKKTIAFSSACVGCALLSLSITKSLWAIGLGLLGLGAAAGLYLPSAVATIASLVDAKHWGKAIAVHELAPNLGFLSAPLLAELFLRWFTWRTALASLGVTSIIVSLAFMRYGRGGQFPGESPASGSFRTLLGEPSFWLMMILFGLGVSSTLGIFGMLPLYLVSERGMNHSRANALIALSRFTGPFLGVFGGWVSDKLGPRRTMATSLFFTGITTLLLGPVPTSWIGVVVFLQPLLAVWFFPAGFAALAMITSARARNLAVSFAVPVGFVLGAGVVPTLIGVMGDAGSFASGFTLVGGLILSGAALAHYLKLPDRR